MSKLTRRDYYIIAAMQGLLASGKDGRIETPFSAALAAAAVSYAEETMKAADERLGKGVTPVVPIGWTKLTDRMPDPDEHDRVLIYTEGYDFNGEQVFDVETETLNECFYLDPDEQPEVCSVATHWMPRPPITGAGTTEPH